MAAAAAAAAHDSNAIPIDQRRTDTGEPLLDRRWIRSFAWVPYPSHSFTDLHNEERAEALMALNDDLHTLLSLPYHVFWSQMIFDEDFHHLLSMFLRTSRRPYDCLLTFHEGDSIPMLESKVSKCFFMVLLRISTHREGHQNFFSISGFRDVVYNNWLFDVTRMIEMCSIYSSGMSPSSGNDIVLSRMITNLFEKQPKYQHELSLSVDQFSLVLKRLDGEISSKNSSAPVLLKTTSCTVMEDNDVQSQGLSFDGTLDVLRTIADMAWSISAFVKVYPPAAGIMLTNNLLIQLADFYESAMPRLREYQVEKFAPSETQKMLWRTLLWRSNTAFIDLVHDLLCCAYPLCFNNGTKTSSSCSPDGATEAETLILTLTSILSEDNILLRYLCERHDILPVLSRAAIINPGLEELVEHLSKASVVPVSSSVEIVPDTSACTAPKADINLDNRADLRRQVLDIFPDVGEGYVHKLLEALGWNIESAINSLLEGSVPDAVAYIDRQLSMLALNEVVNTSAGRSNPSSDNEKKNLQAGGWLSERRNIFDNDEFDVFAHGQIDTNKVHVGKKDIGSMNEILNDKSHLDAKGVRDIYMWSCYDDEHDDTYDCVEAGDLDVEADDMTKIITGKRIKHQNIVDDSNGESDDDVVPGNNTNIVAATRQGGRGGTRRQQSRREASIAERHAQAAKEQQKSESTGGGKHGSRRGGSNITSQNTRDHTITDRDKQMNTKNKAQRANHNRKRGHDKKLRGGMLPS